ncbi:restriction endonuclease subunit S [Wohlfahrtiimonas chitiniclastica]|uniref:restriction endonuclease subunit S n=1 Tax=Wohlfahrtiimonas chitiniclastica TaxID=400946 RepID=UPI000B993E77|nr:restriction endonuclease subunit S [Wohlfahrtiimonas chitiniclastica]OYQ73589.1 hypothetical protein B9T18_09480 [Wohlfahrtiimonas chitiniclastica]
MKLENIAVIKSSGQVKSVDSSQEGFEGFYLVGGNNVTDLGTLTGIENQQPQYVSLKDIENKKLLVGDVILLSKGTQIRAALITEEDARKNLIASSTFINIRLKPGTLYPEVLVSYLNSSVGQANLNQLIQGTVLKNIPIKNLRDLEISLNEDIDQKLIAQLFHQNIKVLNDLDNLIDQQKNTFDTVITKFIK